MASSMTTITLACTVKSKYGRSVVKTDGTVAALTCYVIKVVPSTGTVKSGLDGEFAESGYPDAANSVPQEIILTFKSGTGTQPAVGDTFNLVAN